MRLTREEIVEKYPSMSREDIVECVYGDKPSSLWNKERYEEWNTLTGTLSNIEAVKAYMWLQNGDYYVYNTFIGEIYITTEGKMLGGSINVKYRGDTYSIHLNLMYGWKALDILRISHTGVKGFSSKDGGGSPTIYTKELEQDIIEKVLCVNISDYGEGVQKFLKACRDLYNEDTTNYIMSKRFGA